MVFLYMLLAPSVRARCLFSSLREPPSCSRSGLVTDTRGLFAVILSGLPGHWILVCRTARQSCCLLQQRELQGSLPLEIDRGKGGGSWVQLGIFMCWT